MSKFALKSFLCESAKEFMKKFLFVFPWRVKPQKVQNAMALYTILDKKRKKVYNLK